MAQTAYEKLLAEVSITITPNDAEFLARILTTMIRQNNINSTPYIIDLIAKLSGKVGA